MRETKTLTTPIGKVEVVMNAYVTGGEKRKLRDIFMDENKTDMEKFNNAEDLAWQTVVVSIGGNTENIVEAILNMRAEDTKFITDEVNQITAEKKTN